MDAGGRARFLIRDRDGKFGDLFDTVLTDAGLTVVLSGVRTPRMNSIMGKRRDETGLEEGTRELYVEGLATHGDPESCVDDPRGRGEALTGARAGRAMEPRNEVIGVPTLSMRWKATSLTAVSRGVSGPRAVLGTRARTEPPGARTGRSHTCPTRLITRAGRRGNTEVVSPG